MERKGKCTQAGVCSMYDKVQIITDDDAEFKCCECGEELTPCKDEEVFIDDGGRRKKKNLLMAICAAVVIIGGAIGIFLAQGGDETPAPAAPEQPAEPVAVEPQPAEPQSVAITAITATPENLEMTIDETQQIAIAVTPENQTEGTTATSSDEAVATVSETGEVKALKAGTATLTIAAKESDVKAEVKLTVKEKEPKEKPGPQPKNPSWGKYDGPRDAQGLPHGNGVLRITRSTTINGETAQPGERIEGVFRNGYVNMGTWYKNDGNAVVVKGIKVV